MTYTWYLESTAGSASRDLDFLLFRCIGNMISSFVILEALKKMTLTEEANGATVTTATETTVNEITSDDLEYWGATVFIPSAFTTGDAMEIRFYTWASTLPHH